MNIFLMNSGAGTKTMANTAHRIKPHSTFSSWLVADRAIQDLYILNTAVRFQKRVVEIWFIYFSVSASPSTSLFAEVANSGATILQIHRLVQTLNFAPGVIKVIQEERFLVF